MKVGADGENDDDASLLVDLVETCEQAINQLGRLREEMPGCPVLIRR